MREALHSQIQIVYEGTPGTLRLFTVSMNLSFTHSNIMKRIAAIITREVYYGKNLQEIWYCRGAPDLSTFSNSYKHVVQSSAGALGGYTGCLVNICGFTPTTHFTFNWDVAGVECKTALMRDSLMWTATQLYNEPSCLQRATEVQSNNLSGAGSDVNGWYRG